MKRDLEIFASELERKIGLKIPVENDREKIVSFFRRHHLTFKTLSPRTLDKIALLAGYQSWNELVNDIRGNGHDELL